MKKMFRGTWTDEMAIYKLLASQVLVEKDSFWMELMDKLLKKMSVKSDVNSLLYRNLNAAASYLILAATAIESQVIYHEKLIVDWLKPRIETEDWSYFATENFDRLRKYHLVDQCVAYYKLAQNFEAQMRLNDRNLDLFKNELYSATNLSSSQKNQVIDLICGLTAEESHDWWDLWERMVDERPLPYGEIPRVVTRAALLHFVLERITPLLLRDPAHFDRRMERHGQWRLSGIGSAFVYWELAMKEFHCWSEFQEMRRKLNFLIPEDRRSK